MTLDEFMSELTTTVAERQAKFSVINGDLIRIVAAPGTGVCLLCPIEWLAMVKYGWRLDKDKCMDAADRVLDAASEMRLWESQVQLVITAADNALGEPDFDTNLCNMTLDELRQLRHKLLIACGSEAA